MKPMTKRQIDAVFRKAPRSSEFIIVTGKMVRQKWDNPTMVLSLSKPMRFVRRRDAKQFVQEHPVYKLTSKVVRNLKVKYMPPEFLNCLD